MKNVKKPIAILLACLMLAAIAACGGTNGGGDASGAIPDDVSSAPPSSPASGADTGASNSAEPSGTASVAPAPAVTGRTLNIAAMQDSGTLHPLGVTGGFISVLYGFYEPLYDTRLDGTRRWVLATGLDYISDLQYTLTIREGVTFSNGNPLTAEDVMFSMEACRDNPQFALNVKVVDFEKTKVVDDYTIDLWYTAFNASQEPGFASMLIMDKESYDEVALAREPIGTGPYTVTDYVSNSHLTMTARDGYWGDQPKIKDIQFKVINEAAQQVNAIETGDVDLVGAISFTEIEYVESLGFNVQKSFAGYPYVTFFSMQPGQPLESKEARWAVSHAINRQDIADILFLGESTIPNYPASEYMVDYEERFSNMHETYTAGYDPDRARELADQSGLAGQTLRIITNGSAAYNTIAELVQGDLGEIGVNAEIVSLDQATYFPTMMDSSAFEIAIFTPSAPSWMAVDVLAMYLTFIPLGWSGAERDLYGELSQGSITTYDPVARNDKLFEALEVFVEEDPWYSLCEVLMARAASADLQGVEYTMSGAVYYQDMYFTE